MGLSGLTKQLFTKMTELNVAKILEEILNLIIYMVVFI